MRAGEIVALKWDDIHGDVIEVRRRESMDRVTGEIRIKTEPKNKKPRSFPYTDAIRNSMLKVLYPNDIEKYIQHKSPFIDKIYREIGV